MRRRPASPVVRALALGLLVVGAALTLGAIFADQIGLSDVGGRRGAGFGWTQLLAVIVGLVLLLIGLAWLLQSPTRGDVDESLE